MKGKGLVLYRCKPVGELTVEKLPNGQQGVLWKDLTHFSDGPKTLIGRVNPTAQVYINEPGQPARLLTTQEKYLVAIKEALVSACQNLVDQGADQVFLDTVLIPDEKDS